MGYNTTVIVLNDALNDIRGDPEFGAKLVAAIMATPLRSHRLIDASAGRHLADVSAGCHMNAASVIESHHADGIAIVAVGGNHATVIGHSRGTHHTEEDRLNIVTELADQLGYTLRKKVKR